LRGGLAHRQQALAELKRTMKEEGSGIWLADDYISFRAEATMVILKAESKAIDSILDSLRGGLPKRAR
jgi:hypothetical protein